MRLRLRCGNSYRLGDLQWCMVHVPENVFTVRDFAGHVSRLLELNLHGGNAELPQILLDGFMVPHDEEVREVLRDDEVVDVEVLDSAGVEPSQGSQKRHQADVPGHGGNKRLKGSPAHEKPVMALGWQPDPEKSDADKAVEAAAPTAKALALATCTDGVPSNGSGKDEGRGIFVGGLPTSVDDKELRKHFEQFGTVQDATVVMNQKTGKPKGFGFVEFREPGAREKVLSSGATQQIHGKTVEVKLRQVRGAKGVSGKGEGKGGGKAGKGETRKGSGHEGGKGGNGGKAGKVASKVPQIRKPQLDDSDSDEEEEDEVPTKKAPAAAKGQPQEELSEEMKQMAALGLPVSFTASQNAGGDDSEEEEEEEEGDDD
ncbi:unnamed protein product [Symbiodinium sp. CCMP2456]|nr:unnamed protein product [Symbiodinium sp. CCMP2456]